MTKIKRAKTGISTTKKREIGGGSPKIGDPNIDKMFDPVGLGNPLDSVNYTGDIEHDTKAEEGEVLKTLKKKEKADRERFDIATDTEFWVAFYFQTRQQKEQFLAALDLLEIGDKYVNGLKAADKLGIPLERIKLNTKQRGAGNLRKLAVSLVNKML